MKYTLIRKMSEREGFLVLICWGAEDQGSEQLEWRMGQKQTNLMIFFYDN